MTDNILNESEIKVGYYTSDKGNEAFKTLKEKKSTKVKEFWTKGASYSTDNDFDKYEMLVVIYEIIDGIVYALFADRKYRLPYAVSFKTKFLDKLELRIKDDGKVPNGWRGRASIDDLIDLNKKPV